MSAIPSRSVPVVAVGAAIDVKIADTTLRIQALRLIHYAGYFPQFPVQFSREATCGTS